MSNCVYKDDCGVEVLSRSSKYGATGVIGQNTLYNLSSSALNFHGPN